MGQLEASIREAAERHADELDEIRRGYEDRLEAVRMELEQQEGDKATLLDIVQVCFFACMSVCPSVCLSVCLYVCLSVCPFGPKVSVMASCLTLCVWMVHHPEDVHAGCRIETPACLLLLLSTGLVQLCSESTDSEA